MNARELSRTYPGLFTNKELAVIDWLERNQAKEDPTLDAPEVPDEDAPQCCGRDES